MVGVILKSKFVFSNQEKFSEYISYIDRSEAVRNDHFDKYSAYVTGYMDNPEKQQNINLKSERTSALFTRTKDKLTMDEKNLLKDKFIQAQKNGSPMWQNVISFDNRFLTEHGVYDPSSGMLDEDKMRSVTRTAMEKMLKRENMQESAVWSASIHYNTDNIHIHIAAVEPIPTRPQKEFTYHRPDGTPYTIKQYKAALKPGTLDSTKSSVVNQIVDRSEDLKLINDLIRKNFAGGKKSFAEQRKFHRQVHGILSLLPADRRLWNYNMAAVAKVRPQIDALTRSLTQRYCPKEFSDFKEKLMHEEAFLKSAYSEGKGGRYTNYRESKMREWYERKGNMVLKELKIYDRSRREKLQGNSARERLRSLKKRSSGASLQRLLKSLEMDFKTRRNLQSYESLLREIDRSLEQEGPEI